MAEANEKKLKVDAEVAVLNDKLAKLNAEYAKANGEKEAAIAEADRCSRRLNLAQRLVNALGSKKGSWEK